MEMCQHTGYSHGLEPGTTLDINCTQCKQDLAYLSAYPEARNVYTAIEVLNKQGRTTNNSQIAYVVGISRSKVAEVTRILRQRHYIKNTGKGAAYHWRTTGKPVPPVPNGTPGPAKLSAMFPMGGAR
jgi:hypothetical protein